MNRTKIIATVGPSSENPEVLKDLILEGVNDVSADVNNDGQLNILDVVMCIEIILNA